MGQKSQTDFCAQCAAQDTRSLMPLMQQRPMTNEGGDQAVALELERDVLEG